MLRTDLTGDTPATMRLTWRIDQTAQAAGLVTQHADLQGARAAFEELQAQFSPPPDTHVRPVTAGGISSLLVSPAEDTPATVLYLHGGG